MLSVISPKTNTKDMTSHCCCKNLSSTHWYLAKPASSHFHRRFHQHSAGSRSVRHRVVVGKVGQHIAPNTICHSASLREHGRQHPIDAKNAFHTPLLLPKRRSVRRTLASAHISGRPNPGQERPHLQPRLRRLHRGRLPVHGAVPLLQRRSLLGLCCLRRRRCRRRRRVYGLPSSAPGRCGLLEAVVVAGGYVRGVSAGVCARPPQTERKVNRLLHPCRKRDGL